MPFTPSPQIVQLTNQSPREALYHVLPNLAVRDEPSIWRDVIALLIDRGLSRDEALGRIRFAYTGDPAGQLPPGVE